ncbi:MAG: DUF2079 domain-containing protein [bacterium]|nr:DUF2079 domain-containing protein [bacterium]
MNRTTAGGASLLSAAIGAAAGGVLGAFACLLLLQSSGARGPIAAAGAVAGAVIGACGAARRGRDTAARAAVPLIGLCIPLFFFPDYLVGTGPSPAVSACIAAAAAGCAVALRFLLSPSGGALAERVGGRSGAIVAGAAVVCIAAAAVRAAAMHARFAFPGQDFGIFLQSFWTALQGRLFFNTQEFYPGGSRFGMQFSPVMCILLPAYRLAPRPETLLVLAAAAIGMGGLVAAALARRSIGGYAAACFGLAYLLHPGVGYALSMPIYFMHYAPLFLLLAMDSFDRGRFLPFMLWIALACCTREDVALTTFAFGAYAALRGRGARWAAAPMLFSGAWFAAAVWFVIPSLGPGTIRFFYEDLGGTPGALLAALLRSPGAAAARLLSPSMGRLAYLVLMPLAVLPPIASPEIIFSIPTALVTGLSSKGLTRSIYSYYYLPFLPFAFAGAIGFARRLSAAAIPLPLTASERARVLATFILFLSLAAFIRGPLAETFLAPIGVYGDPAVAGRVGTFRRAVALVPPEAGVFAPRYLMPHLARRMHLTFTDPADAEYVIRDRRSGDPVTVFHQRGPFFESLDRHPGYEMLLDENGVTVHRRLAGEAAR